jgi:invasion protein IalB
MLFSEEVFSVPPMKLFAKRTRVDAG